MCNSCVPPAPTEASPRTDSYDIDFHPQLHRSGRFRCLGPRGQAEVMVTGTGYFTASIAWVGLQHLWKQRMSVAVPRVGRVSPPLPGRTYIAFLTRPGPSVFQNGWELDSTSLIRFRADGAVFNRSTGPADLGTKSLPTEITQAAGASLAGCDLRSPRCAFAVAPPAAAMARLQRLHEAAGRLAERDPARLAPEVARAMEQALVAALVNCLAETPDGAVTLER